ncbi:hypothetical protein H7I40_02750 [Mycolicibacterium madagascariense]|nr:hypothetical protein [Mycolicibacterium madagascariense]
MFGVLLVIGLIVKFFWWLLAAAAAVGLFFAARAVTRHVQERRAAARREAEEIAYRADRQNRLAQRGDARGVYGVEGAALMRDFSPQPPPVPPDGTIAGVANTAGELTTLLADKPPGWRWAVFASVLVQRQATVRSRVRDVRLGYATPSGRASSGAEVARFVTARMDELVKLVGQTEAFMQTPAFMEVFGHRDDESTADAEGIVQVANRLMDYHDRFLALAEECRDLDTPTTFSGLMRDCCRLMSIPLDGYETFIDDFTDCIARMPDLMRLGSGTVAAEPISLHMSVDDELLKRVTRQVRAAAK